MPLIQCPDCGREVSDAAPTCPNCGRPLASPKTQRVTEGFWGRSRGCVDFLFIGLLAVVVLVALAFC